MHAQLFKVPFHAYQFLSVLPLLHHVIRVDRLKIKDQRKRVDKEEEKTESMGKKMESKDRVVRIHFPDPEATDPETDTDSDSFSTQQHKRITKTVVFPHAIYIQSQDQDQNPKSQIPSSLRQHSSKYRGVRKRASGNWAAEIRDPIRGNRLWLGTFRSEEDAHQAYRTASHSIEKEKAKIARQMKAELHLQTDALQLQTASRQCPLGHTLRPEELTQLSSICPTADQMCQLCQMAAMEAEDGAAVPVKKRKEEMKEMSSVIHPQTKKRTGMVLGWREIRCKPISKWKKRKNVSAKKPEMDMVDNPNISKSSVTSADPVRTGSTSSVHNTSAKQPGFLEDLSARLREVLETTPDCDLRDGEIFYDNDLIQLNELPLWTENLDCADFSFLNS